MIISFSFLTPGAVFVFLGGRRHLSLFSPSLSISAVAVVGPIKVLLIEKKVERREKNSEVSPLLAMRKLLRD